MIGFVGLSHLGVVSSIAAAAKGASVIAYDIDSDVVEGLSALRLPVWEPGLGELLEANSSRIRFTSRSADLEECELIVFSPDTPTNDLNQADLATLEKTIDDVVPHIRAGTSLVVLSQVRPGFTSALKSRLKKKLGSQAFSLFCQVETLVLGQAVERALQPERLIVGCTEPESPLPTCYSELLESFDCPVLMVKYESAELAKIALNMFLVSSVSVTNTLAELCEAIGADWSEIVPVLQSDRRIGQYAYLKPGLGLSGGNLERDLASARSLAADAGTEAGVVDAWLNNSRHRKDWLLRTINSETQSATGNGPIALWGLAYKVDTDSTRNSPALELLGDLGDRPTRVYDPKAVLNGLQLPNVIQVPDALDACEGVDVLAVTTPWPEFSSVDLGRVAKAMTGRTIIDPFGALDRKKCEAMGFRYLTLGVSAGSAAQHS